MWIVYVISIAFARITRFLGPLSHYTYTDYLSNRIPREHRSPRAGTVRSIQSYWGQTAENDKESDS